MHPKITFLILVREEVKYNLPTFLRKPFGKFETFQKVLGRLYFTSYLICFKKGFFSLFLHIFQDPHHFYLLKLTL
jgi:hypothetical protein